MINFSNFSKCKKLKKLNIKNKSNLIEFDVYINNLNN